MDLGNSRDGSVKCLPGKHEDKSLVPSTQQQQQQKYKQAKKKKNTKIFREGGNTLVISMM